MSDTPITDVPWFWGRNMEGDSGPPHEQCVDADFARELKQENARLRRELATATETANRNADLHNAANEAAVLVMSENKRLREALEYILDHASKNSVDNFVDPIAYIAKTALDKKV